MQSYQSVEVVRVATGCAGDSTWRSLFAGLRCPACCAGRWNPCGNRQDNPAQGPTTRRVTGCLLGSTRTSSRFRHPGSDRRPHAVRQRGQALAPLMPPVVHGDGAQAARALQAARRAPGQCICRWTGLRRARWRCCGPPPACSARPGAHPAIRLHWVTNHRCHCSLVSTCHSTGGENYVTSLRWLRNDMRL